MDTEIITTMKQDIQITDLIKREKERQVSGLELIASENYVTEEVLKAMGSICTTSTQKATREKDITEVAR